MRCLKLSEQPIPCADSRVLQNAVTLFSTILQDKGAYRRFLGFQGEMAQASLDTLQRVSLLTGLPLLCVF